MLNELKLREDAFKVAVFIGDSYLSNYSGGYINKIANANIHCCIVEPRTQYGSWYFKLSQATNGLLIYNYTFFSDQVLNYIYGFVPDVPIPKYTMILGMSIKTIILKQELKANGTTDTDADTLTDWEEVNQAKVTVNSDGSVQLPTYKAYIDQYEGRWPFSEKWENRFVNVRDANGKTIPNILSEIYVLPVLSDPTKVDGDNDGILDTEEISWNGVDDRYKKVGALHKDTVETLFPELLKNRNQIIKSPSKLMVYGNNVTICIDIVIKGNKDVLAKDALSLEAFLDENQQQVNEVFKRLGEDVTLKELAMDGIVNRWSGIYKGSEYDFYEGLDVNFKVEFTELESSAYLQRKIELTFKDDICGVSNQTCISWNRSCNRYVTLYSGSCNNVQHEGKDGNDCDEYNTSIKNLVEFQGTAAHEFGHVFGLRDMYGSAIVNHGYEPVRNEEIRYKNGTSGYPDVYGIMKVDGKACANDIEMVLYAFVENEWQYYVPHGIEQKISKAIRSNVQYISEEEPKVKYIWNISHWNKNHILPQVKIHDDMEDIYIEYQKSRKRMHYEVEKTREVMKVQFARGFLGSMNCLASIVVGAYFVIMAFIKDDIV